MNFFLFQKQRQRKHLRKRLRAFLISGPHPKSHAHRVISSRLVWSWEKKKLRNRLSITCFEFDVFTLDSFTIFGGKLSRIRWTGKLVNWRDEYFRIHWRNRETRCRWVNEASAKKLKYSELFFVLSLNYARLKTVTGILRVNY